MNQKELQEEISQKLHISKEKSFMIIQKAIEGGEITEQTGYEEWYTERLIPNCLFLDKSEYAKMCVSALKIISKVAPTDFGGSRQRDLGQLWADTTRGYLGEYAFIKWLKKKWNISSKLRHEKGDIEEFLPADIHSVKKQGEKASRKPNIKIGTKTTKWNGIWLDIPGDQYNHSDIHALVKVGTGREHLLAYFKEISIFKDKVLKNGLLEEAISKEEAKEIFNSLPGFSPISAYVCGFVYRQKKSEVYSYTGRMGRKHYIVTSWQGILAPKILEDIKKKEHIPGDIKFQGIGSFSQSKRHIFNTGNLIWKEEEWKKVIDRL